MYITEHEQTYILWSDERKIICVNHDRERLYSYMNILIEKRNNATFDSWLYMCFKHNIYTT